MTDESAGHPSGAALPGTPPLDAREPSPSSAPLPELQALGSLLARARAERAIPASELAQRVCIGEDQLLAVERGDADRLPELVFVVAQARRLAACLGVDAEQEIAALRAAQRSSQSRQAKTQVMAPAPAPRRVSAGPSAKPASRPAALRDAGGPGNRGWLWLLPGVLLASEIGRAHV